MSTATDTPIKETFLEAYNRELMAGRAAASPSAFFALPPHIQQLFSSKLFAPRTPDRVIPTSRDYTPADPTAGFMLNASCIYVHNGTIEDLRAIAHAIETIITVQESPPTVYDTTSIPSEKLRATIFSYVNHPPSNGSYHRGIFIDPIISAEEVRGLWENMPLEKKERFYYFDVNATLDHKTAYPISSEPLPLIRPVSRQPLLGSPAPSSSRSSPPSAAPQLTLERRL